MRDPEDDGKSVLGAAGKAALGLTAAAAAAYGAYLWGAPALLEDQLEHFLARVVRPSAGVDIIGLSLGASYAAEVARRRFDLVRSLVAIEPAGLGGEPEEIGRAWSRLLFTLPGVQRAFYD